MRIFKLFRAFFTVLAVFCLTGTPSLAEEVRDSVPPDLLPRAQVLITEAKYSQAYELLRPYEEGASGDVNYNYLFGIAALDSGHTSVAVFALQRVLAAQPDYSAARMELARAHFELGDIEAARLEFEALYEQDPPPLARTAIINYLSAIRKKSSRYRPNFSYYGQVTAGYDSNANGATDADVFLNFRLDEQSVAQSSSFFEIGYGANYSYPLNDWYQAVFAIGARHRRLPSAEFVDIDQAQGGAGIRYDDYRLNMTTMLVWSRSELEAGFAWDGNYNNSDIGVEMNLRRKMNDRHMAFLTNLRYAQVDYREAISIQDVDQYLASFGLEWSENEYLYRRFGGMLILGYEDADQPGSPYGRIQHGMRLFGSRKISRDVWFLAQGGFLFSEYDGRFFGSRRDDALLHVLTGLDWRPMVDPRWSIQPHLAFYDNSSDISLFEYDRLEVGLSLKWASQ